MFTASGVVERTWGQTDYNIGNEETHRKMLHLTEQNTQKNELNINKKRLYN